MTVAELRRQLERYPDDAPVEIYYMAGDPHCLDTIANVTSASERTTVGSTTSDHELVVIRGSRV
jgi:uncharacterized protein YllA (UPF0747 family)